MNQHKFTDEDIDFIESALNAYWLQAYNNLQKPSLGAIERIEYERQLKKAKELLIRIKS